MWKYFKYEDFACRHCGENKMDKDFISLLDSLRGECGFPFIITSGYRCPTHDAAVSTSSQAGSGPHTTGKAVDIRANSRERFMIQEAAMKAGCTRFGIAKTFIHVDELTAEDGFTERVVWVY